MEPVQIPHSNPVGPVYSAIRAIRMMHAARLWPLPEDPFDPKDQGRLARG